MTKVTIETENLTDAEALKLRVMKAVSECRRLEVKDIYPFFKHHNKEYNSPDGQKKFRARINRNVADEEFTIKLEALVEKLKED